MLVSSPSNTLGPHHLNPTSQLVDMHCIYWLLFCITLIDVWIFGIRHLHVSITKMWCVMLCSREQRVTHILIFLMIGLSVVLTPMLGHIPMPVLFGVFLYMGVASLKGLQFFDRLLIVFMPVKYQPDHMFLRQVNWIWKVYIKLIDHLKFWYSSTCLSQCAFHRQHDAWCTLILPALDMV
jgi:hypothetical protein